ncbi:MAG: ATP-grasp domain-containing protein [Planctomycetota bacterium]|nr:ATP-grasp domain-containing protein [Planctomycetota bacterium]
MSKSSKKEPEGGKAIITYSRGWQSLAATRSLGKRGVGVITGDEYRLTPASFSRYSTVNFRYPSPGAEPDAFLDRLEEVIIEHKPEDPDAPYVLMPIHKETYLIARHRERFERHICVPVPDIEQIEQVHDKGTLAAYAMGKGVPIPRTWLPADVGALEAKVSEIPLPAFVKLRTSAAGVGIQKVDSAKEIVKTFKSFIQRYNLKPGAYPLVQEGVPGEDYCTTTLFDHGELRAVMTYHNLRTYPAEKGAGVLRETVEAEAMEKIARDLLGSIGWHGVAELDFRWDGESEPKLIEINPRFWGGLIQAIRSGWDYPWLLFRLAVDGKVDAPDETRADVRTETPILALIATLREISDSDTRMDQLKGAWREARSELKEGSKRAGLRKVFSGLKDYIDVKHRYEEAKRLLEVHKHNAYDVLSAHDPLPVMGMLYPLAVFFRHGKVNMELLTSEGGPEADEAQ